MTAKTKRYNLLTSAIVSAIHPNEPQQAGTKWEPTNVIDVQEAREMTQLNYAEEIEGAKGDKLTLTLLQRQDEAKRKAKVSDIEPGEKTPQQTGTVPATGGDGQTATTEATPVVVDDEALKLVLQGNVDQVSAELVGMTQEQLDRLWELELDKANGGKERKGVFDAINDAIEALGEADDETE